MACELSVIVHFPLSGPLFMFKYHDIECAWVPGELLYCILIINECMFCSKMKFDVSQLMLNT